MLVDTVAAPFHSLDSPIIGLTSGVVWRRRVAAIDRRRQWDRIRTTEAEMRSMGLTFNQLTYTTLVTACAEQRQVAEARAYIEEMRAAGLQVR
jgi:pentatricopeptide repeat protein